MNWLKKLNQLFTHKELRDDVASAQEQEEYITEQQHIGARPLRQEQEQMVEERPQVNVTKESRDVPKESEQKKAAFRFPLIPDEEETYVAPPIVKPPQQEEQKVQQEPQDRLHVVLEPEPNTPGIRELLAQRQQGKQRKKEPYRPMPLSEVIIDEDVSVKQPPKAEQPLFETRRFVPTIVPSPIYGYGEPTALTKKPPVKEPSTINQLLDKHRQETKQSEVAPFNETGNERDNAHLAQKSILQTVELAYDGLHKGEKKQATTPLTVEKEPEALYEEQILEQDIIQLPSLYEASDSVEGLQEVMEKATSEEELTTEQQQTIDKIVTYEQQEDEAAVATNTEATVEEASDEQQQMIDKVLTFDQQEDTVAVVIDAEEMVDNQQQTTHSDDASVTISHIEPTEQQIAADDQLLQVERDDEQQLHVNEAQQPTLVEQQPVTMQLQQAYVEDLVVNTLQVGEVAEAAPNEMTTRTEKPRPFNVVMLKSDKEKLQKKEALQNFVAQTDVKAIPTFIEKKTMSVIQKQETSPALFDGEVIDEERLDEPFEQPMSSVDEPVVEQCDETEHEQAAEQATNDRVVSEHVETAPQQSTQATFGDDEQSLFPSTEQEVVEEEAPYVPEPNPVRPYTKPSEAFLVPPEADLQDTEWMEEQGERLVEALSHFQVKAQVESIVQGPAVTQFEITVGQGTKVSKVRNLSDDLKLALAARDIRIQAPIPGKNTIGIEIPNRLSRAVRLSEVTSSKTFTGSSSPLEAALGLDLTGAPVTLDLRKMPHGLIAGATGSGKSVCINSILVSLLYKAAPHELKLLLIDPKMVELAPFNHIPHLVSPVITDVKAATAALKWAVDEMERRYQLFAHMGVRDLERYNKLADKNEQPGHKLPYILIVIDELADLMMMAPHDVEEAICRIAQKARACGIHLIVATQRPSVDVITGLIKSNIPTRIAFMVSSQIDSRTILDSVGAERLLGRGDMLYLGNGQSAAVRLQGTFVTDDEIEDIIEHVRAQGEPDYMFQQEELLRKTELAEEVDELFEEVCRFVYERQSASTSSIQRHYRIGYSRAARLVDMLEAHGFVSEAKTGNKPRDVFITEEEIENMFA